MALALLAGGIWHGTWVLRLDNQRVAQRDRTANAAHGVQQVLEPFQLAVSDLAGLDVIREVARGSLERDHRDARLTLVAAQATLRAAIAYVLNCDGDVVACSPFDGGQTLTGNNYAFRPYFTEALRGEAAVYAAVGVTTGVRGFYVSAAIRAPDTGAALGVAVLKLKPDAVDAVLAGTGHDALLVTEEGIVLAATRPAWLYRAVRPLSPQRRAALQRGAQFGSEPLLPIELPIAAGEDTVEVEGHTCAIARARTPEQPWELWTLWPCAPSPLTWAQRAVFWTSGCTGVLLLGAILILSLNIGRRRRAEAALRRANEQLEWRVNERTGALLDANNVLHAEIADRRRIEQQLRTSERRLADIIEFLPDATLVVDRQGRVTAWNRAMERMTGVPASEMLGQGEHAYAVPFYGERRAVLIDRMLRPDLELGPAYLRYEEGGESCSAEAVAPALPGGPATIWATARALYDSAGAVVGAIETVRDVTAARRTEAELRAAMAEAQVATRIKSEFLANMSHEIRTPIAAILGYAEDIVENCPRRCTFGSDSMRAHVETITRNADDLLRILNDVLDLSKVEAGRLDIEKQWCRPERLVGDVVTVMTRRVRDGDVRLITQVDGAIPERIYSDATRIRQILTNLVGNAIKFTPAGLVQLTVRWRAAAGAQPAALEFEITDTGLGMTPEQVKRLFQPFTQGDASMARRFGGAGLGLALSRRLAVLLGGEITVASRPGAGSTFRVTIDPGEMDGVRFVQAAECVPSECATPQEPDRALQDVRILVAEDGPDNQRWLATVLSRAGAEVTLAADGEQALAAVAAARAEGRVFDIILMDMQMPVLDGYRATGVLREQGYQGLIIALTAHAMADDRARCLAAGCDEFLVKPIRRTELLARLQGELVRHTPSRRGAPVLPSGGE